MYKVLLVDDEPRALEGMQDIVDWTAMNCQICGACDSGEEARLQLEETKPDVVLTDIRMPGLDGLELIRWARGAGYRDTQFIIVSAYDEFDYARKAMQVDVTHYLLKPLIEEEVATVVRDAVARLDELAAGRDARAAAHRSAAVRAGSDSPDAGERGRRADIGHAELPETREVLAALEAFDFERLERVMGRMRGKCERFGAAPAALRAFAGVVAFRCAGLLKQVEGGLPDGQDQPIFSIPSAPADSAEAVFDRLQDLLRTFAERVEAAKDRRANRLVYEVKQYIETCYASPLTIRDIARTFYLNPVYLGQAFKRKFHTTITEHIHDRRIGEAVRLLRETELPIGAVAEKVGYAHYHHFLKEFVKRKGVKPADFRGQHDGHSQERMAGTPKMPKSP